jgi:hypothetical protein
MRRKFAISCRESSHRLQVMQLACTKASFVALLSLLYQVPAQIELIANRSMDCSLRSSSTYLTLPHGTLPF